MIVQHKNSVAVCIGKNIILYINIDFEFKSVSPDITH